MFLSLAMASAEIQTLIQTLFRSWTSHLNFGSWTLRFSSQNWFVVHLLELNKVPYKTFHFACPLTSTWSRKLSTARERRAIPVGSPPAAIPPPALQILCPLSLCVLTLTCPQSSFPRFGTCQQDTAGTLLRICPRFPSAVRKGCFFLYTESCGIESPFLSGQRAETWRSHVHLELGLSWTWCWVKGEELGVRKWLTCNMKRTQTWKPCLGFLLPESFTAQHPDPSVCLQQ